MADVIRLPDPTRLAACREALRHRAAHVGARPEQQRRALCVLLQALDEGRSTACAVALALSELRPAYPAWHPSGGAA